MHLHGRLFAAGADGARENMSRTMSCNIGGTNHAEIREQLPHRLISRQAYQSPQGMKVNTRVADMRENQFRTETQSQSQGCAHAGEGRVRFGESRQNLC